MIEGGQLIDQRLVFYDMYRNSTGQTARIMVEIMHCHRQLFYFLADVSSQHDMCETSEKPCSSHAIANKISVSRLLNFVVVYFNDD